MQEEKSQVSKLDRIQPQIQSQSLVYALELIGRNPAEETGDPALIDGAKLVDESKGRFPQTARTWLEWRVERSFPRACP